jgi:hypothetical protein
MKTLLALLLLAPSAQAAVVMKMKQEHYVPAAQTCEMSSTVEKDRARTDTNCMKQNHSTVFTLKPAKELVMIDHTRKEYSVLPGKSLDALVKNPMEALKTDPKFAEQMKKMTPEQKKMMEKVMGQAMGAAKKATLKSTGQKRKVGAWSCEVYAIEIAGMSKEEQCLAGWDQFPQLKGVLETWRQFTRDMARMSQMPTLQAYEQAAKIGLSVEVVRYMGGRKQSRLEVTEIKDESAASGYFDLPKGYKKTKSPMGGE